MSSDIQILQQERIEFDYGQECRKNFTAKQRADLTKQGHAMPNGSFPIRPNNVSDLNNAVSAAPLGDATDVAIHNHIHKHWVAAGKPALKTMPSWLITGNTPKPAGPKADPNGVSHNTSDTSVKKPRQRTANRLAREAAAATVYMPEYRQQTSTFDLQQTGTDTAKIKGFTTTTAPYRVNERGGAYFTEQMHPGLLTGCDTSDTCLTVGHNLYDDIPYARTDNGTLRLSDTPDGIAWEADLSLKSQRHNDLLVSLERKDIRQCSVGMIVARDVWSAGDSKRDIYALSRLPEISLVRTPCESRHYRRTRIIYGERYSPDRKRLRRAAVWAHPVESYGRHLAKDCRSSRSSRDEPWCCVGSFSGTARRRCNRRRRFRVRRRQLRTRWEYVNRTGRCRSSAAGLH